MGPLSITNLFKSIFFKIRKTVELNRYNDFTIAEYFRKQGAVIGEDCRIEMRSLGAEPFLVRIGNHCTVSPRVVFLTHDGATWLFTEKLPSLQKFGSIEILDNCFIGQGAIILGTVMVGPNSIVGAGSVVTKDVPANSVVAGNPAKLICGIEEYRAKVLRIWNEQGPQGYFMDIKEGQKYSPEEIQAFKIRDFFLLRDHLLNVFWKKKK